MINERDDKILYKGEWHYSVRKEFVFNANLSRDARLLYIVLLSFTNKDNKEAFPSRKLLRKVLVCSDRTLSRQISELTKYGYIKMKKERSEDGAYSRNIYELFGYPQNNHTPYMADGKNENLTTRHSTLMVGSSTKIIQSLNNISIAQLLVKDFVMNDQKCLTKISKLVNKFTRLLGNDEIRRILVYLFSKILTGSKIQFNTIEQLGGYLGRCINNQNDKQNSEVWELNAYE